MFWVVDHELVGNVVRHLHERDADGAFRVYQVVHLFAAVVLLGGGPGQKQEAVRVEREHDVAHCDGAYLVVFVGDP
ncbi:hypothetical protein ACFWCB_05320 [Streptomyces sp. NPDC060048]|uniref:hypothetical protein n=1 Tax=unclassified Streptomyces TaxID=2593676 RepID=UPI0036B6527C